MNCSPPGASVLGILQACTLLHSICSNSGCVCVCVCVWVGAGQWTAAHQALLSMGFSRHEHWGGLPLPSPPNLLNISYMRSPVVVKS